MGPICCPRTSVWNYNSMLHKTPKERRLHLHRDGSLNSCLVLLFTEHTAVFHTSGKLTTLLSTNMHGRYRLLLGCRLEKILLEEVDHTWVTLTVAIAFLSSFRALRTVNSLAWPSVCWRLYLLRFSKHSLCDELLVMHLSLRLNNACCMLSRLDGEYAVDFFAKPLVQYSELFMQTWSQEDNQNWACLTQVQPDCNFMVLCKNPTIPSAWTHL